MKRTIGALAALALLTGSAALAASTSPQSPRVVSIDAKQPVRRALPNFDRSAKAPTGGSLDQPAPRFLLNRPSPPTTRGSFRTIPPAIAANAQLSSLARAVGAKDVRTLGLTYASDSTNALGQRFIRYEQRVGGIEVFRSGATALLDRDHQLVALSNGLSPQAFGAGKVDAGVFELSAREAVAIGYEDMVGARMDPGLFRPAPSEGEYLRFGNVSVVARKSPYLPAPARAKKVFFPSELGLIPAWYIEVQAQHPGSVSAAGYAYVVAARGRGDQVRKGELLMRHNLVSDADLTFRVWADTTHPYIPLDGPIGSEATPYPYGAFNPDAPYQPTVPQNVVVLPGGASDPERDPWFEPGDDFSYSNHAFAYADLVEPEWFTEGGDVYAPMNVAGQGFDYTWNENLGPDESLTQIQAAVTQLLYTNHWLHDFFYGAGFDEASGNAQWSNFGRGGLERDAIHAQAQDFGGTDNANMTTPADGASPRMQMYLFNPPSSLAFEVLEPAGLEVAHAASALGPQTYDLTLEVVDGAPDPATCTLPNPAELAGKAVIIPWWIDVPGCSVQQLLANVGTAGASLTLLDYFEPEDPDFAPFVPGTQSLSTIPVIILSYNGAQALRAAANQGPVEIHAARTQELMIDGTLDNAIVAHEWGHYLTNRLIGNGSGLGANQAGAMGEGWSDFVSLLMTTRPHDINRVENQNWTGAYPVATYAARGFLGEAADYFGIRRVPYSVDFTKNALMFRHIEDGVALPTQAPMLDFGNNAEEHNSGEVWATMLWEAYVSLLRAHPFAEAQDRMRNYLVGSLKITPVQPTFIEARDALIAVAGAHDPADFYRFAAAFAKRGMGSGAVAPDRYSTDHAGVVESFETRGWIEVLESSLLPPPGTCDDDDVLDNGEDGVLSLTLSNPGWNHIQSATVTITSKTPGLTVLTPSIPVSNLSRFQEQSVQVNVRLDGAPGPTIVTLEVHAQEAGAATQTVTELHFRVNYDWGFSAHETLAVPYEELNWTHAHDPALGHFAFETTSFDGSFESFGFHGINPSVEADFSLVSPVLEVGQEPLRFSFDHFHAFDHEEFQGALEVYDGGVIELSVDGGAWFDIGDAIVSGPAYNGVLPSNYGNPLGGRAAFTHLHEGFPGLATTIVDLGTAYAGRNVRVRFRIGSDESFGATGWYIDEIRFSGITNAPFATRLPDQTVCGTNHPPTAHAGSDLVVEERSVAALTGSVSDPDGMELVTVLWTQVDGPAITLDTPDAATTTFTVPEVTADAIARFTLTATDGVSTVEDTVTVTIVNVNRAPTADAGEGQRVLRGSEVTLAGSGQDPDGDDLSFTWTQVSGTPITLNDASSATPTFTAPEVADDVELVFALVASDGDLASEPAQVTINVTANRPPVLTLVGEDTLTGPEGARLTVAVDPSDADGDAVSITWSQVAGPTAILENTHAPEVTVTLPSIDEPRSEIVLQATPSDGRVEGASVAVTIVVTHTGAPTVAVGPTTPVFAGATVRLVAQGSDPQGGELSYVWEQIGGPAAERTADQGVLQVQTPEVKSPTTLEFKVTATSTVSGLSTSATATVPVVVQQNGGCGGCSSAGAGTLVPAGLAFLAFALRRRRLKV